MEKEQKSTAASGPLEPIVMWRDLVVGEAVKDGDRFMTRDAKWALVDEDDDYVIGKHTHPHQRKALFSIQHEIIPAEVLDLVRFMCATWVDIDKWAYENMSSESLMKYPVIQGTRNQINLQRIGEQEHETANIQQAVKWLMEEST